MGYVSSLEGNPVYVQLSQNLPKKNPVIRLKNIHRSECTFPQGPAQEAQGQKKTGRSHKLSGWGMVKNVCRVRNVVFGFCLTEGLFQLVQSRVLQYWCIICVYIFVRIDIYIYIYAPIPLHSVSAGSSTNLKDCEVHYLSGSKHEKAQKTQDHMNITHFSVNDHLDFKVSA